MIEPIIAIVKGGCDLGTGAVLKLFSQGFQVIVTELPLVACASSPGADV